MSIYSVQQSKFNVQGLTATDLSFAISTGVNQSTICGYMSCFQNNGQRNSVYGYQACGEASTMGDTIAIGFKTAVKTQSSCNIFIGNFCAVSNQLGTENVMVGHNTNVRSVNSKRNVYMGMDTGRLVSGCNNTFIGYRNAYTNAALATTHNTSLGYHNQAVGDHCISVGTCNSALAPYCTQIGHNLSDTGTGSILIGNNIVNTGQRCLIIFPGTSNSPPVFNDLDDYVNISNRVVIRTRPNENRLDMEAAFVTLASGTDNIITITPSYMSIVANSNLFVDALTTFYKSVLFQSNVAVAGDASFCNNVVIRGELTAGSNAVFDAEVWTCNLHVRGTLDVMRDTTLSNVRITGRLDVDQTVFIHNRLVVDDAVTLCNDMSLSGLLVVGSNAAFCNDLAVLGRFTGASNAAFCNDLAVLGRFTGASNAAFCNELVVGSNATFCNDISVSRNATVTSNLAVYGDTTFFGTVTFCNAANGGSGGSGTGSNAAFCNSVAVNSNLMVGSNATFCNSVAIGNALSVASNATFCNSVAIGNALSVASNATFCNSVAIGNALAVASNATFCNSVAIGDALSVASNATFCNSVTMGSALVVASNATFCNSVAIGNALSVASNATFCNSVAIGNALSVASNATFCNSVAIGNALSVASNATFCNGIDLPGSNAGLRHDGELVIAAAGSSNGVLRVEDHAVLKDVTVTGRLSMCNYTYVMIDINTSNVSGIDPDHFEYAHKFYDNVLVDKDLYVNGRLYANEFMVRDVNLSAGTLLVDSNSYFYGDMTLYGDLRADKVSATELVGLGPATFCNDVGMLEDLRVAGTARAGFLVSEHGAYLSNDVRVAGGLQVSGATVFEGQATFCNLANQTTDTVNLLVRSNAAFCNAAVFAGDAVLGAVTFSGDRIRHDVDVVITSSNAVLRIEEPTVIQDLTVLGRLSLCNYAYMPFCDASNTAWWWVDPDNFQYGHQFYDNVLVDKDVYVQSNLYAVHAISHCLDTVDATAETLNARYATLENLTVTGRLTLCNYDFAPIPMLTSNSVTGDWEGEFGHIFSDSMAVEKDLYVGGKLYATQFMLNNVSVQSQGLFYDGIKMMKESSHWLEYLELVDASAGHASDLVFKSNNGASVVFSDAWHAEGLNHTGKHRVALRPEDHAEARAGQIVVASGAYCDLEGDDAISMDEALPVVEVSRTPRDARVFGVVGELHADARTFKWGLLRFERSCGGAALAQKRIVVHGSGEGGILVCGEGGDIRNGDLICTSSVPGLGMRQEDDAVRSCTVAKATCDCVFDATGSSRLIGCVYMC